MSHPMKDQRTPIESNGEKIKQVTTAEKEGKNYFNMTREHTDRKVSPRL